MKKLSYISEEESIKKLVNLKIVNNLKKLEEK